MAILGAIAASAEPLTLAELAARTGLYKSTILRLLGSLEGADYVARLNDGRYTLGAASAALGSAYSRLNPIVLHAEAVLERLVRDGSESASLHVRHGPETRLCLIRRDSAHPTLDRVREGDVLPLDRGAAGRVLLAFTGAPGQPYEQIRADGIAHSSGEREPGCAGMASPIFTVGGALAGAISLSGPRDRFTDEMRASWGPRLIAAAAEVSTALGGHAPARPA